MNVEQAIQVVQVSFPQVYLACHTRHQRKRSTEHHLSQRDAAILAHLDERAPIMPSRLARHLGIGRSTVSEALKHLTRHGFVQTASTETAPSRAAVPVLLTAKGARAIKDTSVLETGRLRRALEGLSARDLEVISRGMARLAAACRTLGEPESERYV